MNLSLNVHKITIAIALVTLFFTFFGKFLPIGEELKIAIVGFIGSLGAFIKTFQTPPEKKDKDGGGPPSTGVTRIIGGISLLFLLSGCATVRTHGPATLDLIDAVDTQAANVLGFIAPLMPDGDTKVAALAAAKAAKDFATFFDLAKPMLERIAAGGEEVPRDIAAQAATGAAAAYGVEQGVRALSGRNPDGSPKP